MPKNSKTLFISISLIIIIILLSYFLYMHISQKEMAQSNMQRIKLGNSLQPLSALVLIAEDQGFFKHVGLQVDMTNFTSGIDAIKKLAENEVDLSLLTEYAFVKSYLWGKDYTILASIATAKHHEILARQSSGIKQIKDLKNKTIALKKHSSSEFWLAMTLLDANLSVNDVKIIYAKPTELLALLANEQVDAVITWQPHVNNIKTNLKNAVNTWSAQEYQKLYWLIVGTKRFVNTHHETIVKLLKALKMSEQLLKTNPEKVFMILEKRLGIEQTYINKIIKPHFIFTLSLPQTLLLGMENETRWILQNNKNLDINAVTMPNYLNSFYFDALEIVSPDSINIIN